MEIFVRFFSFDFGQMYSISIVPILAFCMLLYIKIYRQAREEDGCSKNNLLVPFVWGRRAPEDIIYGTRRLLLEQPYSPPQVSKLWFIGILENSGGMVTRAILNDPVGGKNGASVMI